MYFYGVMCFIDKSVKKIVRVGYCIDVCTGENVISLRECAMCTYNKSRYLDLYFYINTCLIQTHQDCTAVIKFDELNLMG